MHRDVSINNIVLAGGDKNLLEVHDELRKRLEGFLIDFDYAIKIARENKAALGDRTVCYHRAAYHR